MLIRCGSCRKKLEVQDTLAGELGACPVCKSVIQMPPAEEIAGRGPGDPPLEARAIPQDELQRMLPGATVVVEDEPPRTPSEPEAPTTAGVQTDEEGFVLAVPVEEDQSEPVATTSTGSDEGLGYGLMAEREDERPTTEGTTGPPSEEKIITRCPGCGGRLAIEARYAGKMRTCPGCGTDLIVPLGSTVAAPDTGAPSKPAAGEPVPDALAEQLSADVDLEDYVAEPIVRSSPAVASYWVILAFLVGATVGFVVGWVWSGYYARPTPPAVEPSPPAEVNQNR